MALPLFLAMTASEVSACPTLPRHMAWMACHFSSYSTGLSNLPRQLPEGSLLILNDRIPVQGHDPREVTGQLTQLAEDNRVCGVLLDFQRPYHPQMEAIVRTIAETLPCPVAVTEFYAKDLSCPVFLEAPRAYHALESRITLWQGRELWLEVSYSPGTVIVTEDGSRYVPETDFPDEFPVRRDERLHCTYSMEKSEQQIQYHFKRTPEDLTALLEEAETLGIKKAVGLYQELKE